MCVLGRVFSDSEVWGSPGSALGSLEGDLISGSCVFVLLPGMHWAEPLLRMAPLRRQRKIGYLYAGVRCDPPFQPVIYSIWWENELLLLQKCERTGDRFFSSLGLTYVLRESLWKRPLCFALSLFPWSIGINTNGAPCPVSQELRAYSQLCRWWREGCSLSGRRKKRDRKKWAGIRQWSDFMKQYLQTPKKWPHWELA